MTYEDVLCQLAASGVRLWADGTSLCFQAETAAPSQELLLAMREYKARLLSLVSRRPAGVDFTFPLSQNQHSMLLSWRMAPHSPAYNIGLAVRVKSPLDTEALERACTLLTKRHKMLRTTYGSLPDEPVTGCQHVHHELATQFRVVPLESESSQLLQERVQESYRVPFDLETGPLLRTVVFTNGPADHVLLLVVHHVSCDAWSLRLLVEDLGSIYERESTGSAIPLPDVGGAYSQFVADQRRYLHGAAAVADAAYWRSAMANSNTDLPVSPDLFQAIDSSRGDVVHFGIGPEVRTALRRNAAANGVTPASFLLSAFCRELHRMGGSADIVAGMPVSGTHRAELGSVVGYFVNPLPVRVSVVAGQTGAELARSVHGALVDALEHQDYPLASIVADRAPQRAAGKHPLFQVLFNVVGTSVLGSALPFLYAFRPKERRSWGGLAVEPFEVEQQTGNFDINLEIVDTGSDYYCLCKFRTDVFLRATIEELVRNLQALVAQLTDSIALPVCGLGGLSSAERSVCCISATFTADAIVPTIDHWIRLFRWPLTVAMAPYNQVIQQLLDPGSAIRLNKGGFNIFLVRLDDWIGPPSDRQAVPYAETVLGRSVDDFAGALAAADGERRSLVVLCPSAPTQQAHRTIGPLLRAASQSIERSLDGHPSIAVVDGLDLARLYAVQTWDEPLGMEIGHIPYSELFFAALGTQVGRWVASALRSPYKVIVVDCDNTLWHGVLGEDGFDGISIDAGHREVQAILVDCTRKGFLLCLCSKNDEKEVLATLQRHPDGILRPQHIAAHRINWQPKAGNIRGLAASLRLGLDSFIFLDDDPLECEQVRSLVPEVLTVQVPADGSLAADTLRHLWALDVPDPTAVDASRTMLYQQDGQRELLRQGVGNQAEFLAQLGLRISIENAGPEHAARIAQLSTRTNQFNFTRTRWTGPEIASMVADPRWTCRVVTVSDRYGNYGIVGVMLAHDSEFRLRVEGFMLSCRALGRGVQHAMLARLGSDAMASGIETIELRYVPSSRSEPARNFLEEVCADFKAAQTDSGELLYVLPVARAADTRFEPSQTRPEVGPPETDQVQRTGGSAAVSPRERELMVRIASGFRAAEAVQTAVRMRRTASSRARPRDPRPMSRPATELEQALGMIWTEVIGTPDISTSDNFFDAGGTSLQLATVAITIGKRLGLEVSLVELFEHPTISGLAAHLASPHGTEKSDRDETTAQQAHRQRTAFSSQRQRHLRARTGENT